ncbi:type II toxin-antitoxin system death-on-curing family toxin [Fructilactobacillus hinvesii]|uniref:Type II toxin-antitoxin system death-on-curing family toxin n=1 Tax=Fructilactobacillus hinvesii TaxID=2940300 RepID=A0ABY5BSE2_9LACO|nr:type II toxin-antitoxin system death-on-curing family toxin [Fructilactobacillus hinvesii]USS88043.1 type II toxin-antitoxin system death-on-curing family toxin [Fructilactobacillus hinvesii]
MSNFIKYLNADELKCINERIVTMVGGKNYGVQSSSALDVIVNSPQQALYGQDLYPTIWLKAAFILQKITKKNVFVDGNKRTAIQAALFFLYKNGYDVVDDDIVNNTGEEFILKMTNAPDTQANMEVAAKWLESIMRKIN